MNFIGVMWGFFISINLSTALGQAGGWGIVSSGFLLTLFEFLSKFIYSKKKNNLSVLLKNEKTLFFLRIGNLVKIGLLYGFFVEAFKLGS